MRPSKHALVVASICLLSFCLPAVASAQSSDQAAAERVLGPQWKSLSRRAGMIFAGTVLMAPPEMVATDRVVSAAPRSVQLRFRVDRAIAGAERGQILTLHEWVGASSMHRPMIGGQHVLLFLYPPSRLGLTSPVGGALGEVRLDSRGELISKPELLRRAELLRRPTSSAAVSREAQNISISVIQLERAIRGVREK